MDTVGARCETESAADPRQPSSLRVKGRDLLMHIVCAPEEWLFQRGRRLDRRATAPKPICLAFHKVMRVVNGRVYGRAVGILECLAESVLDLHCNASTFHWGGAFHACGQWSVLVKGCERRARCVRSAHEPPIPDTQQVPDKTMSDTVVDSQKC